MPWTRLLVFAGATACYSAEAGDDHVAGDGDADGDADLGSCDEFRPSTWTAGTVGRGAFGQNLMVEASGIAHTTFSKFSGEIAYARYAGGEWSVATVLDDGLIGNGLGIDSDGAVHFAAFRPEVDGDEGVIVHVTNRGGEWSAQDVVAAHGGVSFALGPDGTGLVAYRGSVGELVVRSVEPGASEEIVDAEPAVCCDKTAVIVGSDGTRHLAYYRDNAGGELRYASDASGQWVITIVGLSDYVGVGGVPLKIVLDPEGRAHVGYERTGAVVIATIEGGVVVDESEHPLDAVLTDPVGFTFALPDVVHVVWFASVDGQPLVQHATDWSGTWVTRTVASFYAEAFAPPAVVTDPRASPWLLYTAGVSEIEMQSVIAAIPDEPWCR